MYLILISLKLKNTLNVYFLEFFNLQSDSIKLYYLYFSVWIQLLATFLETWHKLLICEFQFNPHFDDNNTTLTILTLEKTGLGNFAFTSLSSIFPLPNKAYSCAKWSCQTTFWNWDHGILALMRKRPLSGQVISPLILATQMLHYIGCLNLFALVICGQKKTKTWLYYHFPEVVLFLKKYNFI